LALDADEGRG